MLKIHGLMGLALPSILVSSGRFTSQSYEVPKPSMQFKKHDGELIARAQAKRERRAKRNMAIK
jgi:hypothetical protein